jgi:hypothetical protein
MNFQHKEALKPQLFKKRYQVYITPNGSDETKLLETKFAKPRGDVVAKPSSHHNEVLCTIPKWVVYSP